jgi:hypothetical protein
VIKHKLTEDMIRVTNSSIGMDGHVVRDRPHQAFIGHHMLKDARGRPRRFSSRSAATKAAKLFITEHNQTCINSDCPKHMDSAAEHVDGACTTGPRWTRQGQRLFYDGVEALLVGRILDEYSNAKLSPVTCDAVADYVCSALNTIDLDELTRLWKSKT